MEVLNLTEAMGRRNMRYRDIREIRSRMLSPPRSIYHDRRRTHHTEYFPGIDFSASHARAPSYTGNFEAPSREMTRQVELLASGLTGSTHQAAGLSEHLAGTPQQLPRQISS
ncbi:hypothetical protein DFH06DRAFT_1351634 [Mycena polygramma]|nr:hypothetical protein DFH06DRAFT_1351622 [Mycena polygramma]KAJ7602125.1 hypothetical protein DFH06DRAFT_1351628 [Mycena polygramma]KAJ7602132.1 hypothetical protein DFH06DRAFT_1351634 [Mycena polygramma]